MEIFGLVKTKEYQEASNKIRAWKDKLEEANRNEVFLIREQSGKFFAEMQKSKPELYRLFQIDDKTMGEKILEKLTGTKVIID